MQDVERENEELKLQNEQANFWIRVQKRKLTRESLNSQIKLQESVIKSSFLSSIAGISTAFQVWSKFSNNEETRTKPELTRLVVVLCIQTWTSLTLFVIQNIDNSVNMRHQVQSFKRIQKGGIYAILTLILLLLDITFELWEIKLMVKL